MKNLFIIVGIILSVQAIAEDNGNMNSSNNEIGNGVEGIYVGGGFSYNSFDTPFNGSSYDATGLQAFLGYDLGMRRSGFETAIEAGFSNSGEFDFAPGVSEVVKGVWINGVASRALPEVDPKLTALIIAGIDLGDDDGLQMGVGAAYKLAPETQLRVEYLNKDSLTTIMMNVTYRLP